MATNTDLYNDVLRSYYDTSFLCHHGIKGQKWGIRNYQNSDGTLTSAGKERYRSNAHIYKPRSKDTMQREIASGKIVTVSGGGGEQYYEVEDWEKENLQMEDDIQKYEAIAEDENATPEEREDALRKANILRRNLELKRKAEQAFLSEWVSSQEVWRSLGHEDTMNYNDILKSYYDTSFLCHHGILGMKWGIRRFQNKDGTLTEAGKKRYQTESPDYLIAKKQLKSAGYKEYHITAPSGKKHYEYYTNLNGLRNGLFVLNKRASRCESKEEADEIIKVGNDAKKYFGGSGLEDTRENIAKRFYDQRATTSTDQSRDSFKNNLSVFAVTASSVSDSDVKFKAYISDRSRMFSDGFVVHIDKDNKIKRLYPDY